MGKDKTKKKKPLGVRIALGLGIPLVIIGLLIGSVFVVFGDNNDTDFVGVDNYSTTQVVRNIVTKSLGNAEQLKEMEIRFGEEDFNQIFYNVSKDVIPEEAKNYLDKLYVEFNNDGINFYLNAHAFGFKTRLVIATKIENGQVDGKDAIILNIQKISVGMVDFFDLIMKLNTVNNSMLESLFKSSGLSFKADLANKRLYYLEESISNDLNSLLGGSSSLVGSMISHFQSAGLVNLICSRYGFGAKINLQPLETNSTYIGSEFHKNLVDIHSKDAKSKIYDLLVSHIIDFDNVSDVFGYLTNGYSSLNDEQKAYIDTLDLSSIDIYINSAYEGYRHTVEEEDKIENIVASQIAMNVPACISNPGVENKIISISEYDIDNYLASTSLIGTSYVLASKSTTGVYNVSYIDIDNFYSNIVKDHIYYVVGININGLDTRLIVDTKLNNEVDEPYNLSFNIDNIYYGETIADQKLSNTIINMMGDAINGIGEWVNFSAETKTIEINVQNLAYSNPTYGEVLRNLGESRTELSDTLLDEEGSINIFFKSNI